MTKRCVSEGIGHNDAQLRYGLADVQAFECRKCGRRILLTLTKCEQVNTPTLVCRACTRIHPGVYLMQEVAPPPEVLDDTLDTVWGQFD
jgi:hypothetical protein